MKTFKATAEMGNGLSVTVTATNQKSADNMAKYLSEGGVIGTNDITSADIDAAARHKERLIKLLENLSSQGLFIENAKR